MFSNIIGHKNVTTFLEKSVQNDLVSHAYLFYGPSHLGKRTVAEKFIEMLLGKPVANHPDVYLVERARNEKEDKMTSEISIEQMRELERKLSLSSFLNSYKIGIIEEAEKMSIAAANSLLKTLEEPTPKTVIILLSESVAALPATIVSRCQTLKFLSVSQDKIYKHLLRLGASHGEALDFANAAWGKPGKALDFWQSREEEDGSAIVGYREEVKNVLGLMQAKILSEKMKVFGKLFVKDDAPPEDLVNSLNKVLSVWISVLRDMILVKNNCSELICNSVFAEDIEKAAGRFDVYLLPRLYRSIITASKQLQSNFNPRLVLENLVLSF